MIFSLTFNLRDSFKSLYIWISMAYSSSTIIQLTLSEVSSGLTQRSLGLILR